jgi:CBS domain-containing protein
MVEKQRINFKEDTMPVTNFCGSHLVTLHPGASLQEAAELMDERNVGFLIINGGDDFPVGVLTDRDIVTKAVAKGVAINSQTVADIMSRDIVAITWNADVPDVVEKMRKHMVRRVVVLNDEGKACGIVSSDDLIPMISKEVQLIGDLFVVQSGTKESHKQHDFTRMA